MLVVARKGVFSAMCGRAPLSAGGGGRDPGLLGCALSGSSAADLAHRDTAFPVQSQYLAHIAHLRPPRRHPFLPAQMQPQGWPNDQAPHPPAGGRELIEMPAGITSEHRPGSNRNGGRDDVGIRKLGRAGTVFSVRWPPLAIIASSSRHR